ncbi:hypothetical protein BGZ94_002213 [Podila epigama]|nr:hypothetical protein BGZ94_002213 [Podila epigama]
MSKEAAAASEVAAPRLGGFRFSPGKILLHLLPAVAFTAYTYTIKGPFQPTSCITFNRGCQPTDIPIQGILESEHYAPIVQLYHAQIALHDDLGGSLAIFADGKPKVDIAAGFKDIKGTQPYTNNTLQQVYSSGKVIEGIVIARLVQSGFLDYDAKVSDYWPEFAQNGKEDVRLVDVMTHESGIFFLDDAKDLNWESLKDKEAFSALLARQPHYFGKNHKGVKRAYQAVTRGWYLNEIVRRVDPQGRTIGEIAKEELMVDYPDIELYFSHFPNNNEWWESRLSPMIDYPLLRVIGRLIIPNWIRTHPKIGFPGLRPAHPFVWSLLNKKSLTAKSLAPSIAPSAAAFRTIEAHATESTSFSLKTNAHSLAKLMGMMANKGASLNPGQEPDLMDEETYKKATTFYSEYEDLVVLTRVPLSNGGWLKSKGFRGIEELKDVEVQGWGGAGGSLTIWVEELNLGFSYVTNAFGPPEGITGDIRGHRLLAMAVKARKRELGLWKEPEPEPSPVEKEEQPKKQDTLLSKVTAKLGL